MSLDFDSSIGLGGRRASTFDSAIPGGALELRIDGGVPPRKMAKIFSETCNVQKDTHSGTSSQRKYTLMET